MILWFYNGIGFFLKQQWFKAARFSISIYVLARHVPGWIYKSLHLMRAGPKTSRTAGKQELIIITRTSPSCEGSAGWGTMCSISTGRNFGQQMLFSIETSTTISVEIFFPVNCSMQRFNLLSKIKTTFVSSSPKPKHFASGHQTGWMGSQSQNENCENFVFSDEK